jgi:uncharacterized protein YciI
LEVSGDKMHFILFYELSKDYLERRSQFRKEHLELAEKFNQRGELILAGALAEPVDSAILVFSGSSAGAAENFAMTDPYVKNGLVTSWQVRRWTTVVGEGSSRP